MRRLLVAAVCCTLAMLPGRASAQDRGERPNVVLIMTDDMGYGDLPSYGGTDIRTPNIDRLVREGVRLTDFYANGATCTPTRAGLITGRYQQRVELEAPLGAGGVQDAERGLTPTGRSLPRLLANAGYATGLVGKWHLGWKPEFSPTAHGFSYFFGFKSGYVDYYTHTSGGDSPTRADLFENDRQVDEAGYMTDLITERSVGFIRKHARQPFFLDVAYNTPHWPYQPPGKASVARDRGRHLSPFDDSTSTRAEYVAMMEQMDRGVGQILDALDRLGLRDNTIVIFTNDNGGEWLSRSGPLFHHKGSVWEGGIRVPAIVRWPGRIPAGTVSRQVGITMDLTASILAATGARVPADASLEGIDLLPILRGTAPEVERTLFWRVAGARTQRAVRSGDWKLVLDGRAMLFNLREDIGERRNIIAEQTAVARALMKKLDEWQADLAAEVARNAVPKRGG
jgi:arylsulfatase A-like enzyme